LQDNRWPGPLFLIDGSGQSGTDRQDAERRRDDFVRLPASIGVMSPVTSFDKASAITQSRSFSACW
jgi:hypothetical protein